MKSAVLENWGEITKYERTKNKKCSSTTTIIFIFNKFRLSYTIITPLITAESGEMSWNSEGTEVGSSFLFKIGIENLALSFLRRNILIFERRAGRATMYYISSVSYCIRSQTPHALQRKYLYHCSRLCGFAADGSRHFLWETALFFANYGRWKAATLRRTALNLLGFIKT